MPAMMDDEVQLASAPRTADPVVASRQDLHVQVITIGHEQTPVAIIDDFLADTGHITDHAQHAVQFGADGRSAYPGIRAALPQSYVSVALAVLQAVFRRAYRVPDPLRLHTHKACYSLISRREHELMASQCVPHFDSNRPYYFAVTHYLNAGTFGGTGFFRHKVTGFENVTDARLQNYLAAGDAEFTRTGGPAQRYITASNGHYELYGSIRYKPNRLVAYPGTLLHSGLVVPATDIDPDPASGRLTANLFLEFL